MTIHNYDDDDADDDADDEDDDDDGDGDCDDDDTYSGSEARRCFFVRAREPRSGLPLAAAIATSSRPLPCAGRTPSLPQPRVLGVRPLAGAMTTTTTQQTHSSPSL